MEDNNYSQQPLWYMFFLLLLLK